MFDQLRDRAEVPGPQAPALDAVRRGVDRSPQRRRQCPGERGEVLALGEGALSLVHHSKCDLQMVGYAVELPGVPGHIHAAEVTEFAFHNGEQRPVGRCHRRQYPSGVVRRRDEGASYLFGQRSQQRCHQFLAQARYLPVEAVGAHLVEHGQRDAHGHAVRLRARFELVGQRQAEVVILPGIGVVALVDPGRVSLDQHGRGEGEQVGFGLPGLLPPAVEVAAGDHLGGDPLVVEVEQRLVVDQDVAAPRPVFQLLDVVEQFPVGVEEPVVGLPVALDQGMADEQVPAQRRVDRAVGHRAGRDQGHPVERHLLERHHRAPALLPVRFAVGAGDQVGRERLRPLRLDACERASPQPGRLDELGGHHPARWLLEQRRTGEDGEPGATRTLIVRLLGVGETDV